MYDNYSFTMWSDSNKQLVDSNIIVYHMSCVDWLLMLTHTVCRDFVKSTRHSWREVHRVSKLSMIMLGVLLEARLRQTCSVVSLCLKARTATSFDVYLLSQCCTSFLSHGPHNFVLKSPWARPLQSVIIINDE